MTLLVAALLLHVSCFCSSHIRFVQQIAAVGARALGAGLSSNTLLTSLNLRLNNLGDQGASALLAAVCMLMTSCPTT